MCVMEIRGRADGTNIASAGNADELRNVGWFRYKHTHTHNYFAASTVQTAQNIRQKLAIWDNKHKLYGLQQQQKVKTVCWSSFNCLIKQLQNHPCSHRNNSSQAAALSGKCMRRRQSNGLLASLIRNVRSGCLQAGGVQKSVSHLAVTRHICVAVLLEKLLRSAGPRLICLGLSVRRLHQKGTGDLKAPSFHRSTSFFPFCSHLLSPNLFLRSVLLRRKLGV